MVILDMPGYGVGSQVAWGLQIMKYLESRQQLRMAFVLIDSQHGPKATDWQLLSALRSKDIPHQVILSKIDKILLEESAPARTALTAKVEPRLQNLDDSLLEFQRSLASRHGDEGIALGEIIGCTTKRNIYGRNLGIDAIRFAILRAAEMEWNKSVKPRKAGKMEIVPYDQLVWKE